MRYSLKCIECLASLILTSILKACIYIRPREVGVNSDCFLFAGFSGKEGVLHADGPQLKTDISKMYIAEDG